MMQEMLDASAGRTRLAHWLLPAQSGYVGFTGDTKNIFLAQLRQSMASRVSDLYAAHAVAADSDVTAAHLEGGREMSSFCSTPTHLQPDQDLFSASPASSNVELLLCILYGLH
jgi:hypothetical protein